MSPVETLGLALGAGFSSGLNLYATVVTLGLLQRFGVLHLPPSLQVPSRSTCWNSLRTKSPTSIRFGTPSTRSFVRQPLLCSLSPPPGQPPRNGVGAPRCSPAESLSLRTAQRPARGPPSTLAPNRSAIGF